MRVRLLLVAVLALAAACDGRATLVEVEEPEPFQGSRYVGEAALQGRLKTTQGANDGSAPAGHYFTLIQWSFGEPAFSYQNVYVEGLDASLEGRRLDVRGSLSSFTSGTMPQRRHLKLDVTSVEVVQ